MMATLLIVDDDNNVRETLRALLIDGHECHTADRAEQALAFLEFENYDAILTDLAMPGLSGRELLQHVKQKQPGTPVIVISGMAGDEERSLLELGAFAYFTKPFQLDEIEEAVTRAVNSNPRQASKPDPPGPASSESPKAS
jgi:two-component system response regulator AtoC